MKFGVRFLAACLLIGLIMPQQVSGGGDKGKNFYDRGEVFFAREDYRTAMQYYRKALGQNDVRAHYRVGLIYEDAGKERDALRHYRRYVDLGRPGRYRDDAARRITDINGRLTRETDRSSRLLEHGKSLFTDGKYREAEKALLEALVEDGSNPEIHFYLGEVYMELEEYGKAESEYTKAKSYY